jgi:hypothetical protein
MVVKETCCTNCAHREICSLTKQFLKAQEAVDNATVTLGEDSEGRHRFTDLRNIKWIEPVKLVCKYYLASPTTVGIRSANQDGHLSSQSENHCFNLGRAHELSKDL